jgi:hypothetical protein
MCHAKKSLTIYGDGSLTINASYNDSISTDGIFNLTRGGGSAGNSGKGGAFRVLAEDHPEEFIQEEHLRKPLAFQVKSPALYSKVSFFISSPFQF